MDVTKKIVLAEDHTILRDGLRSLLNSDEQYEVAGEAADGLEAIRCIEQCSPDLILLDLSMPRMSGASVIKEVKARFPEVKVLALSVHDSEEYILESFQLVGEHRRISLTISPKTSAKCVSRSDGMLCDESSTC
jgi:DNA-binding NarL/FixJ family response regulator